MEFLIVTGLSGAGKTRANNALEDIGFFCADNIPPKLITTFYELSQQAKGALSRVAVVTDIRGGDMFSSLIQTLDQMTAEHKEYKILFLDANDYVLINRFKETRRKHPLADNCLGSLEQAVKLERNVLRPVRERADYIINTSNLTLGMLQGELYRLFVGGDTKRKLVVNVMSFGYKYGIPLEADLVFDVRFLPNPFYVEKLRESTGLDRPVSDFVFSYEDARDFMSHLTNLMDFLIPLYIEEGKYMLNIAIGCTGGRHRSVAVAKALSEHLAESNLAVSNIYRDIDKG